MHSSRESWYLHRSPAIADRLSVRTHVASLRSSSVIFAGLRRFSRGMRPCAEINDSRAARLRVHAATCGCVLPTL